MQNSPPLRAPPLLQRTAHSGSRQASRCGETRTIVLAARPLTPGIFPHSRNRFSNDSGPAPAAHITQVDALGPSQYLDRKTDHPRPRELFILSAPSNRGRMSLSGLLSASLRPKIVCAQRRAFRSSAAASKALAFSLNNVAAGVLKPEADHGERKVLRMLMFGKPGAGKGTLSARLTRKYDVLSLSTGDLLRQQIAER